MRALSLLAWVAAALFVCGAALARPGGGQSYRSSSGGSGSWSGRSSSGWSGGTRSGSGSQPSGASGGSTESSGSGTYSGPSATQGNPRGLPLGLFVAGGMLLVIVVMVSRANRRAASVRGAVLDAQYDLQAESRRSVSLDDLRARDPTLTEESIVERVRRMSDLLRDGWTAGDMRPARPFMSDGCYSRFQVQLELMRTEGVRNVMSDTKVLYVTLEAVQSFPPLDDSPERAPASGGSLDIVHVRFTAAARDATVPLEATPEQVQAKLARTPVTPYTEIWTLVRRRGAQTKQSADSVGKACPSCGAPFDSGGGEVVACTYCKALVCSGEHDWVLSEITQLSEWHPNSADEVPGLDGLREVDLGVTRETLEDRASYCFWKWIESGRKRSAAPLRKAATAALVARGGDGSKVASLDPAGASSGGGARDIAVGGAELLLCDVARNGEEDDYAYVSVYWSARFAANADPFPRNVTLRLARKSGSSTKLSMTQVTCPSCGGPLAETDDPRCGHCGVDVVATGQVWALDAVLPPGALHPRTSPRSGAAASLGYLVPDVRDPRERAVLFSQMAQMMTSGGLQRDEKRLLVECGRRWSIPEELVSRALSGQLVGPGSAPQAVASPEWFLAGLVAAALIDGTIDAQEQATLERVCAGLRLPREALDQQIAATRQRMSAPQPTA